MLELFDNGQVFYGTYVREGVNEQAGKVSGKHLTRQGVVTPSIMTRHLEGSEAIGISPLSKEGDLIKWAAIDLDDWNRHTQDKLVSLIYEYQLPFCPCYSKSKHLHLYTFLEKAEKAYEVRNALQSYARLLDLPVNVEIFPKQNQSAKSGNWINLPYFGSERHMLDKHMKEIDLGNFLERASSLKTTVKKLNEQYTCIPYSAAPHCVRTAYLYEDVEEGSRNNIYFNACVYWKIQRAKNPDVFIDMNEVLDNFYQKLGFDRSDQGQALTTRNGVIGGKAYGYQCGGIFICVKEHCFKDTYGISSDHTSALLDSFIYKVRDDPPTYRWVMGNRELYIEDERALMNCGVLKTLFFREFDALIPDIKPDEWRNMVNTARGRGKEYDRDAIPGFSRASQLDSHIKDFLRTKASSQRVSDVYAGRLYRDLPNHLYYFQAATFMDYLRHVCRFKGMADHEVMEHMRVKYDMKAVPSFGDENIVCIPDYKVAEDPREFMPEVTYEIIEGDNSDF
jgi:hypothetical protein